ncbi:MAG: hypothetical protein K8R17_10580, partial [Methanosarcinales archaeon]|nr:hypothetical protein [Methanosarcinales archaeon]
IGIVAVALILAISMTASARPDPVGATTSVQNNNVTLGTFNGTSEIGENNYTKSIALSTKQAQDNIYYSVDEIGVGSTHYNISITYTNASGGSTTVYKNDTDTLLNTWETVSVVDLVNITNINCEANDLSSGWYNITVVVTLAKQTAAQATVGTNDAEGGYITEMNLDGNSQTVKWQGYYGNIDGKILLADENGYSMFNWTWDAASGGSVFAIARTTMPNFTAVGVAAYNITPANADVALTTDGTWSQNGTDSVNITFGNTEDNSVFNVSGYTVAVDTRASVATLNNTGGDSNFTEVLLSDQTVYNDVGDMIWTCIIADDETNYAGDTSDYQMIVPAKDSAGGTTTYYFYVELL